MTLWSDILALTGLIGFGAIAVVSAVERATYDDAGSEQVYDARRSAQLTRLVGSGIAREQAAGWCLAWQAEAARQGRDRHSDSFWRDGGRWIDEQRNRARRH